MSDLITAALDRAARQCSVKAPSSWVTATQDDHVSLRDDFLLETVDDILERVDMPAPIGAQTTITGDGSETYTLPANFKRLHRSELAVYDQFQDRACVPITTDGEWTYIKDIGTAGTITYYRLSGYAGNWSISFYDEPSASQDIVVSYSTVNWMANVSGTAGSLFTAEDDVLMIPRRLIETGIVWRFRERRGLPYQDKFNEYETLIAQMSNDRRGRRTINFGDKSPEVRWQDLIPAFIPPS
jgi:hypothetical protein